MSAHSGLLTFFGEIDEKELLPDGGPAFPIADHRTALRLGQLAMEGIEDRAEAEKVYMATEARATRGMSLLDYTAIEAMKSMIGTGAFDLRSRAGREDLAKGAYDVAEIMVQASAKRESSLW